MGDTTHPTMTRTSSSSPSAGPIGRSRRWLVPLATALVALTAAACGDGGSSSGAPPITGEAALRGEQLASDNGCRSCHTPDGGRSTGPTWKGLAGSEVELDGGDQVTADDAYLARAITDPDAQVAKGFPAIMPSSYDFTDDELADLVAYLRALSPELAGAAGEAESPPATDATPTTDEG